MFHRGSHQGGHRRGLVAVSRRGLEGAVVRKAQALALLGMHRTPQVLRQVVRELLGTHPPRPVVCRRGCKGSVWGTGRGAGFHIRKNLWGHRGHQGRLGDLLGVVLLVEGKHHLEVLLVHLDMRHLGVRHLVLLDMRHLGEGMRRQGEDMRHPGVLCRRGHHLVEDMRHLGGQCRRGLRLGVLHIGLEEAVYRMGLEVPRPVEGMLLVLLVLPELLVVYMVLPLCSCVMLLSCCVLG